MGLVITRIVSKDRMPKCERCGQTPPELLTCGLSNYCEDCFNEKDRFDFLQGVLNATYREDYEPFSEISIQFREDRKIIKGVHPGGTDVLEEIDGDSF